MRRFLLFTTWRRPSVPRIPRSARSRTGSKASSGGSPTFIPAAFRLRPRLICGGVEFRAVVGRRRAAKLGPEPGLEVRLVVPEEAV